ncbi:hypothetical protein [Pseudomonas syringae group genomosp. 3]|uniref:Uncharacterized protein n=1 Tax=Pseudomonas syringae pv. tomato (strain ATCC BAA-871 / DC3000) TaxID=223283 RepID=Q88AU1_PSESM|nr:hypothetical protein [Pseudomonas syringae group genomosp. 3]AAO53840.1 protein of unknown function [Pseudomonas syringae pv. tomato str. DC3000]KPY85870.1 Uncharacterized protein ALO36_03540 [Pseudomonas syringae pv. tomato]
MQQYQKYTETVGNQDIIAETAVVLELLAFALAIIAMPGTTPIVSKVLATLAQHTASSWAELLAQSSAVEGGAQ